MASRYAVAGANENPGREINFFRGPYGFLSNMHHCLVYRNGVAFPSAEHAFVAAKLPPLDENGNPPTEMWQQIAAIESPTDVKRFGKKTPLRVDWKEVRLNVMREIVFLKFSQNQDLKKKLLATGNAVLVEKNNWHDYFWGVCNGKGENHLGKILMTVRLWLS